MKQTKKQQIIEFLQRNENKFSSIKNALNAFIEEKNEPCHYAMFSTIARDIIVLDPSQNFSNTIANNLPTDEEINFVDIKKLRYSDEITVPTKAGCQLDTLMSTAGGIMPATICIVPGESGIGKTSVLLDYCGRVKTQHPEKKILFISTEMNRIHMFKYGKRINVSGIDLMFLGEYQNVSLVVEKVLQQGWDIVLIDSFQDCVDKCRDSLGCTLRQAESWLLRLMDKIRLAENDEKKYTSFFCTQHMTKGAQYTGSTNLKHMTDSMMDLRRDKEMPEYTYLEFSKNRDGAVWVRQYFKIGNDGVQYIGQPSFEEDEDESDEY